MLILDLSYQVISSVSGHIILELEASEILFGSPLPHSEGKWQTSR